MLRETKVDSTLRKKKNQKINKSKFARAPRKYLSSSVLVAHFGEEIIFQGHSQGQLSDNESQN